MAGRKSKASEKGKKVSECIENEEEGQKEEVENQEEEEEEEDEPMNQEEEDEPMNQEEEEEEDEPMIPSSEEEVENQEDETVLLPSVETVENQEDEPVLPSSSEEEIENEPTNEEKEREEEVASDGDEEVWDIVRVIPTAEEQVQCRMCTEQAVATWASNNKPNDMWDLCETCQLDECGGWPTGVSPIEYSTTSSNDVSLDVDVEDDVDGVDTATEITTTVGNNTIKNDSSATVAIAASVDEAVDPSKKDITTSEESKDGNGNNDTPQQDVTTTDEVEDEYKDEDEDDVDESFDLRQIISLQRLLSGPPLCSGGDSGGCSLPACSVWTSSKDPKDKWYYCIDCQKQDFGGWPPAKEMPCDRLEPEHLKVIAEKCSKKKNPVMPVLTRCITPLPNSPKPPKGVASQVVARGKKEALVTITGTASSKNGGKTKKPSKGALGVHAKWLEAAKKNGGNRIILDHTKAKKAIFDTLFDAFQPMNFNDLYKKLKGEIPSALLTNLLKEMSIGAMEEEPSFDSDDEDDDVNGGDNNEKEQVTDKKKSKGPLGSLIFKQGRNIGSCLYYVDYTQKPDMTADERQSLFAKTAATDNEHEMLTTTLKFKTVQTKQLLSEPTNDELTTLLSDLEKETSNLVENVEAAQALTVNEAHKTKLKRKIQKIGAAYAKRKRLCTSALSALEEISEGTLSSRKILAGDGQICIDSDESVNKAAIAYAKDKRGNKGRSSMGGIGRKKSKDTQPSLADEDFIGVSLDAHGSVKRVFAV